jgi:hypothetical protein
VTFAAGAQAQTTPVPNWRAGAAVSANLLIGGGGDVLDGGLGVGAFGQRHVAGPLWVRGDVWILSLAGAAGPSDTADNTLTWFGVGPQIEFGEGLLSGYARGVAGVARNTQSRTGSSLPEESSSAGVFGGGVGGRIRLSSGRTTAALDLGIDLLSTGDLKFARSEDGGGGPETSATTFAPRVGITLGF